MTMKFWGPLLLLAAVGCASAPRPPAPAAPAPSGGARQIVDRLRVDPTWQPPVTGGECVSCWYELPQGSYIAQGWYYRRGCSPCGWDRPIRWSRGCRPMPACQEW